MIYQKENEEFEEYAASKIREWKAHGMNVDPVIKTLEKERQMELRKSAVPNSNVDHYSRLGFTARWLPAEPELPSE
jgi:hypothetical protein